MKTKIFFLTLSLFLFTSFQVHAASFTVNSVYDVVDMNPGDGICHSTDEYLCTLRAAIMEINALMKLNALKENSSIYFDKPDTVQTYKLMLEKQPLIIEYAISLYGNGANKTIIDGLGKTRIFEINLKTPPNAGEDSPTPWVYLQGVTLTNGRAPDLGGAIGNLSSNANTLTIENSTIGPNNVADFPLYNTTTNPAPDSTFKPALKKNYAIGGAIYHRQGYLQINNVTFIENKVGSAPPNPVKTGYGAAIYMRSGTLSVTNSKFENNQAHSAGQGGAIFMQDGYLDIDGNSQFLKNKAASGGAIYNQSFFEDAPMISRIVATTFEDNQAQNGDGGAIFNEAILQIEKSVFKGNTATSSSTIKGFGGAIAQNSTLALSFIKKVKTNIYETTFTSNTTELGNSAKKGGALYQKAGQVNIVDTTFFDSEGYDGGGALWLSGKSTYPGFTTISRSTFEKNEAINGNGGAISTAITGPSIVIYNSTLSSNSANFGGGIYADKTATIKIYHTTIAENEAKRGGGIDQEDGGDKKITLNQSMIVGNKLAIALGAGPDCNGQFISSYGGNIIGNRLSPNSLDMACNIESFNATGYSKDIDLQGNYAINTLINPLAQNGGKTKSYSLPSGSPAINGGVTKEKCLNGDLGYIDIQNGKKAYELDQNLFKRDMGDYCDSGSSETGCGNGMVDDGEECDSGPQNSANPDSCRTTCTNPACGDGILDSGEECDDGNDLSIDACSAFCKVQPDNDGDSFYDTFLKGSNFNDCDDTRADINPKAEEICDDEVDQNCDKVDLSCDDVDNDGDGMTETQGDCDDTDAQVKKADNIPELCDGKDNNCDGVTDGEASEDAKTFYVDADGDGHAGESKTVKACSMPEGTLVSPTDCDDTRADINPDIMEICDDEVDQNCDGLYLDCKDVDNDGDGMTETAGDCDDTNALVHPGEPEHCDKIDNTCNGEVDEGCENIVPKDGEDAPPFIPVGPIVDDLGGGDSGVDDTGDVDDSTGEDDGLGPTDAGDGDNADDDDTDADADASKDKNDGDADADADANDGDDGDDAAGDDAAAKKGEAAGCSLNPARVDITLTPFLLLALFVTVVAIKRRQQQGCSPS